MNKIFGYILMFAISFSCVAQDNQSQYFNEKLLNSLNSSLYYMSNDALNNPYLVGYRPLPGSDFDVLYYKLVSKKQSLDELYKQAQQHLSNNPCDSNVYCDIKEYHLVGMNQGKIDALKYYVKNEESKNSYMISFTTQSLSPIYVSGKITVPYMTFLTNRIKDYSQKCENNENCLLNHSKDLDILSRILSICYTEMIIKSRNSKEEVSLYNECLQNNLNKEDVQKQILYHGYLEGYTKVGLRFIN